MHASPTTRRTRKRPPLIPSVCREEETKLVVKLATSPAGGGRAQWTDHCGDHFLIARCECFANQHFCASLLTMQGYAQLSALRCSSPPPNGNPLGTKLSRWFDPEIYPRYSGDMLRRQVPCQERFVALLCTPILENVASYLSGHSSLFSVLDSSEHPSSGPTTEE